MFVGRVLGAGAVAAAVVAGGMMVTTGAAAAATNHVVTSTAASGPGTLKQAIDDANASAGDDTITFAPATNGHTLQSDTIEQNHGTTTITGNGVGVTIVDSIDVNSTNSETSTATVSQLTIQGDENTNSNNGSTTTATFSHVTIGDGIDVNSNASSHTTGTFTDVTVTGGGGNVNSNFGSVSTGTFTRVDFENDSVDTNSSGSTTKVTMTSVTINKSSNNGLDANDSGTTDTIVGSTFSNNNGIAVRITGGATVNMTNSTVTGNFSDGDGAIDLSGGKLLLQNVTIAGNDRGLRVDTGRADLTNTIVADNGQQSECFIGEAAIVSHGGNISSDAHCPFTQASDQQSTDPNLGALANNGGPTKTMLPPKSSAAVDKGVSTGCPSTDQRGVARPQDGNDDGVVACDSGAVELAGKVAATTTTTVATTTTAAPVEGQATSNTTAAELPRTGTTSTPLAMIGFGAFVLGATVLAFNRRRSARTVD